jgi:predicted kinase
MRKREIIVLQGPPACGKSTYAKELHKQNQNYVIVSRDKIREARGDYWIPAQEDYISAIEEYEVRTALDMELTPVIDATNLNPKTLEKWERIAGECGAKLDIREMEIPTFEEALLRDVNRERPVGPSTMKKFYSQYYPHLMEETRNMKKFTGKPKVVIVDIDGTISLRGPRHIFEYKKVYTDKPDFRLTSFLREILGETEYKIIFLTGRDEECRDVTVEWLEKHFYSRVWFNAGIPEENWTLYMRPHGDNRPDFEVKREIYKEKIEPWCDVAAVFEDRDQCVDMWRGEGLLCLQPARGNF